MENSESKFLPLIDAIENAHENVHYQDFIKNFFAVIEIVKDGFKLVHFSTLDSVGHFDLYVCCYDNGHRLTIRKSHVLEPLFFINGIKCEFSDVINFIKK